MIDVLQDILVVAIGSSLALLLSWLYMRAIRRGRPLTKVMKVMLAYGFLFALGVGYSMMAGAWFQWPSARWLSLHPRMGNSARTRRSVPIPPFAERRWPLEPRSRFREQARSQRTRSGLDSGDILNSKQQHRLTVPTMMTRTPARPSECQLAARSSGCPGGEGIRRSNLRPRGRADERSRNVIEGQEDIKMRRSSGRLACDAMRMVDKPASKPTRAPEERNSLEFPLLNVRGPHPLARSCCRPAGVRPLCPARANRRQCAFELRQGGRFSEQSWNVLQNEWENTCASSPKALLRSLRHQPKKAPSCLELGTVCGRSEVLQRQTESRSAGPVVLAREVFSLGAGVSSAPNFKKQSRNVFCIESVGFCLRYGPGFEMADSGTGSPSLRTQDRAYSLLQ